MLLVVVLDHPRSALEAQEEAGERCGSCCGLRIWRNFGKCLMIQNVDVNKI